MSVFSPSGSAGASTTIVIPGAESPTVANVDMPSATTEYSYLLPDGTKQFLIRTRSGASFQVAYVSGQTGSNYLTISRGSFYSESELTTNNLTVYFQSQEANQTAEIVSWV